MERLIVQHLYTRWLATILATWGLSLIIQQTLEIIFGAGPQGVDSPISGTMNILGASYPAYRVFIILFSAGVLSLVLLMFSRSNFGLDIRTVIQDRDMAEALGIDTKRIFTKAFMLGAGLAALAGVLVGPLAVVIAQMGVNYLAKAFFVVIVGGAGSFWGIAAGSTFVGGLETVFTYQMPVTLAQALVLALGIIVLRFRPQGIVPHANVKW
ncbi:branched-chain amino acid ABC transporter permease [Fodinicurvata halophila]|uniref:branched-chain amino acid ABC transporter permease n=1 Tax=Fodinicurvata halophila TaxID=1419723 RepID=UPI00363A138B